MARGPAGEIPRHSSVHTVQCIVSSLAHSTEYHKLLKPHTHWIGFWLKRFVHYNSLCRSSQRNVIGQLLGQRQGAQCGLSHERGLGTLHFVRDEAVRDQLWTLKVIKPKAGEEISDCVVRAGLPQGAHGEALTAGPNAANTAHTVRLEKQLSGTRCIGDGRSSSGQAFRQSGSSVSLWQLKGLHRFGWRGEGGGGGGGGGGELVYSQ